MLYLGAGVRQVKVGENQTLYIFPDFSDTRQFYYLPNSPHIARMEDGVQAIRLLVYRANLDEIAPTDAEVVAFLSLDVDLSWPPEVIERAASKLRVEDQLTEAPRLTPIFFSKGSVKLMLLDAATPDPGAPEPTDGKTRFVTKIMGAGSPSLDGNNRAIFQAALSKEGAVALSGALDGVTPIGVVYSLTFAGLQPAFRIKAKVDWEKVYDHFSEREVVDLLFYESDIQKSIDKLRDEKVIDFDVTVEGIGADAMDAEREQVMNSIRQLIFEKFFEATFKRETAAGDGIADTLLDVGTELLQASLTFGVGYTYKRKEVTIEELRSLDIDWTARKATERTIYPQAHMYSLLKNGGVTRDQLITVVTPDDLYRVLPFDIIAAAAWKADGIAGISVDVEYTDPQTGATRAIGAFLDEAKPRSLKREWMDRKSGSAYRYKYEVVFQDGGTPGPSTKAQKPWTDGSGTALTITPSELYEAVELEVLATPDFPFDRWPAVQTIIRYRTDDGSFEHYKDGVITSAAKAFKTRFRIDKGMPGRREVQVHFMGASGEDVVLPWAPMPQSQYVLQDPHGEDLEVSAIVSGDRANVANLLVDLEYRDTENGIHETGKLAFDTTNINQQLAWKVHLANPLNRRYRYRMTLVTKTGDFLQTGWISTDAPSIPVGEVYVRRLTVEFNTGELGRDVEAVEVKLQYDDNANDLHVSETLTLGEKARAEWVVPLKDASARSYSMTTTWKRTDGFNPKVGPIKTSETFHVLPGSPPQ